MTAILFWVLLLISTFGVGFLFIYPPTEMSIIAFTIYMTTLIYGTTYYQTKWIMRLFKRKP